MKQILLLVFTTFCFLTEGQIVRQPLAVKYTGLGAYSKKFADVFSGTSNQASLAGLKKAAFGVYGERRFMLDEMNGYSAILALPTTSGTFGLQGDYFGSAAFNESQLGISYARKIAEQVDIGVKFNYHAIRVPGYGSLHAVNFEGGAIFHLTERLHTGLHVYNPTRSKLSKNGTEKLASIYRFGLGYEASDKVFVSTEIVKQESQPVSVNAGLQYNVQEKLFLRAGVSTFSNNSYAGIGLLLPIGRIDINTAYHPQLGFTPGLLLLITLHKETVKD